MKHDFDGKEISAQVLERLVSDRVPAGHHLVYLPTGPGTPSSNHELAEAAASLANAHGGFIVLGVRTEGGRPLEMVGLGDGDPERSLEEARRVLAERIHANADAHVTVVRFDGGGHTLVVEVPPSLDAPHLADGIYPQRHGRTSVVMSPAEIDRVRAHRRNALEGFRARARELADAAQYNRIVKVKAGSVGLHLYVASVPLLLLGREAELAAGDVGLPRLQVLWGGSGEALELRRTHFGALGTRPYPGDAGVEELAYLTRRGELLHGLPDARPFRHEASSAFCVKVDELEKSLLEALPRNLVRLMDLGFAPPFYVALIGGGEGTHVSFGQDSRCGYPSNPQELVVEALLPLARLRATDLPGDDEVVSGVYYAKLARPIRPFLDRLYHAAGFASPWPESLGEPS